MTTFEELKKIGWAEVERQQQVLSKVRERVKEKPYGAAFMAELSGKIQGMVWILNHIK